MRAGTEDTSPEACSLPLSPTPILGTRSWPPHPAKPTRHPTPPEAHLPPCSPGLAAHLSAAGQLLFLHLLPEGLSSFCFLCSSAYLSFFHYSPEEKHLWDPGKKRNFNMPRLKSQYLWCLLQDGHDWIECNPGRALAPMPDLCAQAWSLLGISLFQKESWVSILYIKPSFPDSST